MAEGIGTDRITRGMHLFQAFVGVTFVILAVLHVPHPSPWLWLPYAAGAVLAFLSLVPRLGVFASRLLAIAATALMFSFFAGFFTEVPKLESDWYQSQEGWSVVSLLLGAFTLIPVLSNYSCRCKAEHGRVCVRRSIHHHGFFTAPEQARPPAPDLRPSHR